MTDGRGAIDVASTSQAATLSRTPSQAGLPLAWLMGLMAVGVLVHLPAWIDMATIGWLDEESSQVLLVPVIAGLLIAVRWQQARQIAWQSDMVGPLLIAVGWLVGWYGYRFAVQSFWHGGAVLTLVGCVWAIAGRQWIWRMLPVVIVLVFLIPVPGRLREMIALPLQNVTAQATQFVFELMGMDVGRTGNVLWYRGQSVGIAEACNGMRMVFVLILVSYAAAFLSPLRLYVRVLILLLSPVVAIICNVIRLVPTVYLFGTYSDQQWVHTFHDLAGWAMIFVGFGLIMGCVHVLRWAQLPVMQRDKISQADADNAAQQGASS